MKKASMAHIRGLKIASNTNSLRKPRQLDLLGKDWNSPIINIHKELKKTVSKKFKEIMRRVFHQIISIKTEITMMSQLEILELKEIIIKMKNLLKRFNSSFLLAEKRIYNVSASLLK